MGGDYGRGLFKQLEELEALMAKMESRYTEKLHKVEQRYEASLQMRERKSGITKRVPMPQKRKSSNWRRRSGSLKTRSAA